MAVRLLGTGLLLLLLGGTASRCVAREPQTICEKYLFAGIAAEQAGQIMEAERLFLAAVAEAKKSPADAPRLGIVLGNLAGIYSQKGEEGKALAFNEQALAADERVFGPVHPRVANDLTKLGLMYGRKQRDAEAEKCLKRALEIQEQEPETPVYQKINLLINVAEFYIERHRLAESEPLLEREIEILESTPERGYARDLENARRRLADVYRQEGRESEAQTLEYGAYDGVRPSGDPALDSILTTLDRAEDSRRDGKLIEAEAAFREVVAATEGKPGVRNASMRIAAFNGLARVCAAGERDDEAEGFLLSAFALREHYASLGVPWMAGDLGRAFDLNALYQKQGRLFDMEPIYERALAIQGKVLGSDDKAVAETSLLLADLYFQEEKYREALPLYAHVVEFQEKNLGPSIQFAETLGKYAAALQKLGEEDEAAAIRARAQAIVDRLASQNKKP